MPFALLAIGLVLVIAAYNNTQSILSGQLQKDFSGKTGFIYWIAAIIIVGALGYIDAIKNTSRAFLGLIIVAMFLSDKGGVFAKFNAALAGGASAAAGSEKPSGPKISDAPASKSGTQTPDANSNVPSFGAGTFGLTGNVLDIDGTPLQIDLHKRPDGVTVQ